MVNIKSTNKRWEGGDTKDKIRYKPSELLNKETSEPSRAINNHHSERQKKGRRKTKYSNVMKQDV